MVFGSLTKPKELSNCDGKGVGLVCVSDAQVGQIELASDEVAFLLRSNVKITHPSA